MFRKRDENRWRIPKDGTISADVYKLTKEGKKPGEISKLLNVKGNIVRVLLYRIRNPERANESSLKSWHKRSKHDGPTAIKSANI